MNVIKTFTKKWWVSTVTAAGTIAVAWIEAGALTSTIKIALVGLVVQRFAAWAVPNDDTPGGVPLK